MGNSTIGSLTTQSVAALRKQLGANGFLPIPIKTGDKMPLQKQWQIKAAGGQFVNSFVSEDSLNTGILCDGLRAIDIDIDDPALANEVAGFAAKFLRAKAPKRSRNNSGRVLLLYRAAEGEPKKRKLFDKLFGKDKPLINIEVLGKGNQFVAFGTHPSGAAYQWDYAPTDFASKQLLTITEDQIQNFFDKIRPFLWAENYLLDCCEKMATADKGQRDDTQNTLAYSLGGLVPNKLLRKDRILDKFWLAVTSSGRPDTNTEAALRKQLERSIDEGMAAPWMPTIKEPAQLDLENELLLASKFTEQYGDSLRYTAAWNKWHLWDGITWRVDEKRKVFNYSKKIVADCHIPKTSKNAVVAAVVTLANSDEKIAALAAQWDANPYLTNMCGIARDVLKGETRQIVAEDYITKTTKVSPDAGKPKAWTDFLDFVTYQGDEPEHKQQQQLFIDYLQRMCGYFLTGSTKEDALFFLYGPGKNGKSVFIDTISGIMGDYATGVPMEALLASKGDRHPTELAKLMGARLAVAVETEQGRRWDESKVKTLTGGDKITARFMRQDFFDFVPTHKLLIAGNNKPHLSGKVDEAWRRRFHIIPFTRVVDEAKRDKNLRFRLQEEWPQILAWMVEGCNWWMRESLNPPQVVIAATNEYLEAEDTIGRWLEDCCEKRFDAFQPTEALFASWCDWCKQTGEFAGRERDFSLELAVKGYKQDRQRVLGVKYRGFIGITLAPKWTGKE